MQSVNASVLVRAKCKARRSVPTLNSGDSQVCHVVRYDTDVVLQTSRIICLDHKVKWFGRLNSLDQKDLGTRRHAVSAAAAQISITQLISVRIPIISYNATEHREPRKYEISTPQHTPKTLYLPTHFLLGASLYHPGTSFAFGTALFLISLISLSSCSSLPLLLSSSSRSRSLSLSLAHSSKCARDSARNAVRKSNGTGTVTVGATFSLRYPAREEEEEEEVLELAVDMEDNLECWSRDREAVDSAAKA